MPINLEKLFSPTVTASFDFLGDTVTVVYQPWRYTGEMQDMASALSAEEEPEEEAIAALRQSGAKKEADRREAELRHGEMPMIRTFLSQLLVSWDVMDGRKRVGTDLAQLNRLPDVFLRATFMALAGENQPDPQNAPDSEEPSSTERTSARSRTGTRSSRGRGRSE